MKTQRHQLVGPETEWSCGTRERSGRMRRRVIVVGAGLLAILAGASAWTEQPASVGAAEAKITRGKYLVTRVGMCGDCHTPHNAKGEAVMDRWLLGSELPFKPTVPMPWMAVAPPIAGLPTLTHDQAVHFLMTGERPGKPVVMPPMPEYRLDKADAEAVTAYLKSLAK